MMRLALAVFLAATAVEAKGKREKLPAKGLSGVEIKMAKGEVSVMAWNGDHVTVEKGSASLKTSVDRGTLTIESGADGGSLNNHVKVFAPEHLTLKVTTKHGKVDIQGFSSRIQVLTMGGGVRVSSCFAQVEVETVGGDT